MNKQKKQLLILAVLMILAAGMLALVLVLKNLEEEKPASNGEEEQLVFSLDGEIVQLDVSGRQSYHIERVQDGTYILKEVPELSQEKSDESRVVSQERIDEMEQTIRKISSKTVITNVKDFEQYGLESPLLTVNIKTDSTGSGQYTIEIGSFSEAASMYYARFNSGDSVYLITTLVEIAFDFSPEELTK